MHIIKPKGLIFKFLICGTILFSLHEKGDCQSFKIPEYTIEAGGVYSAGRQTPFWLVSNQFGKNTTKLSSVFASAKIHSDPDTVKIFDFGYGLEIFEHFDGSNNLRIQQANFKVKFGFMHLRIGSEEETYGNQDRALSSGSMMWSENTRPMPKLVLATNGYTDVPFTQGYAQFSGLLSHGWFGDDGYVKDAYLHHKNVYIKAGGKLPVNLSFGLQHYAMWGGVSPEPAIGELPSDFKAYTRVFFSKKGEDSIPGVPLNESLNKIGNHLGSWNYGIDVKLDKYLLGLYYQTIFEDYSGFSKWIMKDGLWGVYVKTKNAQRFINAFTYEYIHTSFQSGPPAAVSTQFTKGNDNFFNNSIYRSGWTYDRFTIGTPLISSPSIVEGGSISITNNRVVAHHFGLQGEFSKSLCYRMFVTISNNYGLYNYNIPNPESKPVQSVFIEISKSVQRFQGLDLIVKIAADHGELYGNNGGILLAVRKRGYLFKRSMQVN